MFKCECDPCSLHKTSSIRGSRTRETTACSPQKCCCLCHCAFHLPKSVCSLSFKTLSSESATKLKCSLVNRRCNQVLRFGGGELAREKGNEVYLDPIGNPPPPLQSPTTGYRSSIEAFLKSVASGVAHHSIPTQESCVHSQDKRNRRKIIKRFLILNSRFCSILWMLPCHFSPIQIQNARFLSSQPSHTKADP